MRQWGDSIRLETLSIEKVEDFELLLTYERHYGGKVPAPPVFFVGKTAVFGPAGIMKRLDTAISAELTAGSVTYVPPAAGTAELDAAPKNLLAKYQQFSAGAVALAGLVDGVNPCAFTTIVFFLSMLTHLKKTRAQMLAVGAGFTVGMFTAYFLLGVGLLGAVKMFSVSHGFSSGLAWLVGLGALALSGWSFLDAIRYMRSGDTKQVTLGLPKKMKMRIHKVIREGLTARRMLVGSVSIGFVVSLLESLCTGQVYLPTIVFVTRQPGMKAAALGYLVLYNVMFILPLVGILALAYFGVRSETLGNMLRKRLALAKFCMAALFAGLGLLVLGTT